jgi:hypothetical protein
MPGIEGIIDNVTSFNVFGGWARLAGDLKGGSLRVEAFYEEKAIGDCSVSQYRADMGKNYGFALSLKKEIDFDDIVGKRVKFVVVSESGTTKELGFYPEALRRFEIRCFGRKVGNGNDSGAAQLLAGLTTGSSKPLLRHVARAVADFIDPTRTPRVLEAEHKIQFSYFPLRFGVTSSDASAVVGRDGRMFVLHGANSLIEQYNKSESDAEIKAKALQWANVFRARRSFLKQQSSNYLQFIVPEKSSVIPDLFPAKIHPPTTLLKSIKLEIEKSNDFRHIYFDCFAAMGKADDKTRIYRRMDSHLSAYGARHVMLQIISHLGMNVALPTNFSRSVVIECDLGKKFNYALDKEEEMVPDNNDFLDVETGLTQVELSTPASGAHIGTKSVWKNSSAPLPLKVVAFGNSFFEAGTYAGELSWWAARCFREFHFLWSPVVDIGYVEKIRPDLVICQTIERFLPLVPKS